MELALIIGHPNAMPGAAMPAPHTLDVERASLEELMEAYVAGNASAFEALYARLSSRLFGYLLHLTRRRDLAEDLLQVTFSKVHRARASYLTGAPLLPWIFAIARRAFLDEMRRAKHRTEDLSPDGRLPEAGHVDTPSDLTQALEAALAALPDKAREAIVLTKVTGLTVAEAGQVLGCSAAAVKLRVHRGYKELRESLRDYGERS